MEWKLLGGLAEEDRRRVLALAARRRFARNEVLFHEGDPGDSLHLIERGHVGLRVTTRLGDVVTLNVLGPGVSFGQLGLLGEDHVRTATAVALDAVETMTLQRGDFDHLCNEHPRIHRMLAVALAADVRRLSERVQEFLFVPAVARVNRRLYELACTWGDGEVPAIVPLSQETIATMAGTTRPTANRALRAAEAEGWIELRRGKIVVNDLDALAAHSD